MRDGHFREDENELPYLVYERRDSYSQDDSHEDYEWGDSRKRKAKSAPLELHFTDIPFWEFPSYVRRLNLSANHKQNIISSVEIHPKNSTFSIHQQLDEIRMSFKVKNEYLTTELTVRYDCGSCAIEYVYGSTRHDGLESISGSAGRFEKLKIKWATNMSSAIMARNFQQATDGLS